MSRRLESVYVSQTWVSRLWRENGLVPWRQGTFKISKDPNFEDKVRDVVGLYLDPPEGEVVVSVDAKSGIQGHYYGAFYRSALYPLLSRINAYLVGWVRKKYKRLRSKKKARVCWEGITKRYPRMFAHWKWVASVQRV